MGPPDVTSASAPHVRPRVPIQRRPDNVDPPGPSARCALHARSWRPNASDRSTTRQAPARRERRSEPWKASRGQYGRACKTATTWSNRRTARRRVRGRWISEGFCVQGLLSRRTVGRRRRPVNRWWKASGPTESRLATLSTRRSADRRPKYRSRQTRVPAD